MTPGAYAMITGNPSWGATAGTQVNVRAGAGTNYDVAFTATIGATNLIPLAIESDALKKNNNGKIYQWVQLRFHDARTGWVRDDLLSIQGDFTRWGYPDVESPMYLFSLARGANAVTPPQQTVQTPVTQQPVAPVETVPVSATPAPSGTNTAPVATTPVAQQPAPPAPEPQSSPAVVTVIGLSGMTAGQSVNVRSGAGTNKSIAFRARVGDTDLRIRDMQPDDLNRAVGLKVYQWAQVQFPDGRVGWIRDDLISVRDDARQWGYGNYASDVRLFDVVRQGYELELPPIDVYDQERIRQLAFAITSRFEGKGYDAYNNYDAGIISYGFIQFTLAAGSLVTVVNTYLQRSQSDSATQLRQYQAAIGQRDPNLRHDGNLQRILTDAAHDPIMQQVQREIATAGFWQRMADGLLTPRNLTMPLTWALMFDISVNFGINAGFLRRIERDNNIPALSPVPNNVLDEKRMIAQVVELRRQSHYRQAERDNLPGLKVRGDFWVQLVEMNDWEMRGLPMGSFNVKRTIIDAANPVF